MGQRYGPRVRVAPRGGRVSVAALAKRIAGIAVLWPREDIGLERRAFTRGQRGPAPMPLLGTITDGHSTALGAVQSPRAPGDSFPWAMDRARALRLPALRTG